VKESTPVKLAEYAVANKLVEESTSFMWWIPYTLKKRDQVVKAVKRQFHRKNEKFGMEVPNLVKASFGD
jgi:phosphoribosyl-ATP pyrophosphohydrolase